MTLPPERIGDLGQRYKVEAEGYPSAGWHPIGYSDDYASARRMATVIELHLMCSQTRIIDRQLPLPLEEA